MSHETTASDNVRNREHVFDSPHVIFADVQRIVADSLCTVLAQHGYRTGLAANDQKDLMNPFTFVQRHRPDCCIVEPKAGGERKNTQLLIGDILAAHEGIKVLARSERNYQPQGSADVKLEIADMIDAGACGYVDSNLGNDALVSAIERVLSGEVVIETTDTGTKVARRRETPELRLAGYLTGRERQCLHMLVDGLDTAAMIELLGVSRTTVRTHLQAVLTKLGVHSRLEAATFAVRNRLPDLWAEDELFIDGQPIKPGGLRGRGRE